MRLNFDTSTSVYSGEPSIDGDGVGEVCDTVSDEGEGKPLARASATSAAMIRPSGPEPEI